MQFELIKRVIDKKGKFFISPITLQQINNELADEFYAFLKENNLCLLEKSAVMYTIEPRKPLPFY